MAKALTSKKPTAKLVAKFPAKKPAMKSSAKKPASDKFTSELARRRSLFANMTEEKKLEIVKAVCEIIASTERGVVSILKDHPDFPNYSLFYEWLDTDKALADIYTRAKFQQAECMGDKLLDIADDGTNDWTERENERTGKVSVVLDGEHVQRSRLRVETRKWLMAHLKPHKFGDRQILAGDPEAPLSPVADLSALSDAELQAYLTLQRKLENKS